jgi:hypothetical protein
MGVFLLAMGMIIGAGILGLGFTWVAFNVKVPWSRHEDTKEWRPMFNGKEDYKFWVDFNNNRHRFASDREWRLDYEERVPHFYNEKPSTRR